MSDLENSIESVDKNAISEAMDKHVYDRDFAAAGVGMQCFFHNHYKSCLRIGNYELFSDDSLELICRFENCKLIFLQDAPKPGQITIK